MEFESSAEDERKLKNLATRILSNGVEVLVKDKNSEGKQEQRQVKLMHNMSTMKPTQRISLSLPQQSLISSAVATVVSRQQMNAMFPLHQLMQHNYIIKTCMTTYTYLTTVIQNKRSAVSTFETTVSVVTTESLTNLFASEIADLMPTKTKYVEMKTIQPSISGATFHSNLPKIDKRIDNSDEDFDFIQPSEVGSTPCTSSCSCSQTKTEGLKTSQINAASATINYGIKTPQYGLKIESNKDSQDKKTQYSPYEYENSQSAPTDRIVEKYTEVINEYSEEKESNSVEASDLLTNEQAPNLPTKNKNKVNIEKTSEKPKPDKPQKVNKNKFVVADLLKLGSLGIKGLSQLAPVFEKMTGGFIRRQDINKTTSTTTSKPVTKITPYVVNKRVDSEVDYKQSNFPIYIPVDEMETSESQTVFTNATLHQNLVWAAEHKQPKAHIVPPRIVHESPLVNGGIPISPGEIIRANSDVIVGKPAVGGPLTLAASGIKLHNPVNPPILDSIGAGTEDFMIQEKPHLSEQSLLGAKIDDSYDLRPPMAPKPNQFKPNRNAPRPAVYNQNPPHKIPQRTNPAPHTSNDHVMKTEKVKSTNTVFGNHGRPAFLDYIPSLGKPNSEPSTKHHVDFRPVNEDQDDIPDNSPSSSEMFHTRVTSDGKYELSSDTETFNKPLLVDIQPSRVANVLIPHGSSTALVFAGSSEPHKTGDYIDDPLPYPEPGYFGSFSIDAPQLTNVHNVAPNNGKKHFTQNNKPLNEAYKPISTPFKDQSQRHDQKYKWKDSKRPIEFSIPPPTSKQETHSQVGPQITVYNPNIYNPQNNFEKYHHIKNKDKQKDAKEIIDKEYENYLAVPPPPPKMQFNHDINNKNKPYSQRPVVHTKPVQDMKVFLNIQHPIPNSSKHEQIPTKVTSEVYYAEQKPNSKPSPTYTIHIPPSPPTYGSVHNKVPLSNSNNYNNVFNTNSGHSQNSFTVVSSPNFSNKSVVETNIDNSDNTYSITLNTATNVASNGDSSPVIGSSMPVSIDNSNIGSVNANIPIGTNFAMKVESSPIETYNKETYDTPTTYEDNDRKPYLEVTVGDNRWNESKNYNVKDRVVLEKGQNTHSSNKDLTYLNDVSPSITPSQNSHANFPMLNNNGGSNIYENTKPVSEVNNENNDEYNNVKNTDQKRPGKRIPNIPTNSHGWYSNIPINENSFDSLNNIKVEGTTRKVIPLLHNYDKHSKPEFGQKVTSIGKPPTEYYAQNTPASITHHGKPFSKSPHTENTNVLSVTNTYDSHYIPSNFGIVKQPAYDIPIRDNSDETTTAKYAKPIVDDIKPVYENSEEIYDGKEENESNHENEGDGISSESMKVPVVSSSSEEEIEDIKINTNTTNNDIKDQINVGTSKNKENMHPVQFYPGTQTEKPFKNQTISFQSNAIKPIYNNNSHMRPRPFAPNSATLDNQLHQPHWQINQMMENSTNASYEENLELNMGEEMSTVKVSKPTTHKNPYHFGIPDSRYKLPVRPVFSLKLNNTHANDSIITSTIHINNKNPLIVKDIEKSTLPSFTMSNLELNRSSSEIIDLSPPPPTMDYNFKPSTNDEMIMGMSPPPPRTPPARLPARQPPTPRPLIPPRSPPPFKTKPSRTLPPRLPTQRPTRKPTRDEVSTYRPAYDVLNNAKRPTFNRDQPSSQLLPPPRDVSSEIIKPIHDRPISSYSSPNVVFPTPISSGWLTSSGFDFSSSFDFGPTSVQFPHVIKPSEVPNHPDASSESSNDYYVDSSSERNEYESGEKPSSELSVLKENMENSSESIFKITTSSTENVSDMAANETSQEDISTERNRLNVLGNKNRTRKPYPTRNNEKKTNTNKYKSPSRPVNVIKPTSVLTRPDLLNPTRHVSIKKIVRPLPSRHVVTASNVIESSESPIKDDFIKPTEVLKENITPTIKPETVSPIVEKVPVIHVQDSEVIESSIRPIHHAGNEVKIVDEILPTKTEFRTTVVTLTKTLSEPPKTVSSIGYVNLTHTLTVTHTKTSLISQSEGAVTQTLVLTNTQTSTIVDVITEIHTQVQPTTIIETVTKHIQIPQVEPTPVITVTPTSKVKLDDLTMSSEEENLIIRDDETTENVQKISTEGNDNAEGDNDTFFVVMNKSQGGGAAPPISTDIDTGDYDGITRNEQVNNNGVSQVLFGEILLAGTPYLETNVVNPTGLGKECQPDCKASRNERCQRIDGLMKCVCRPGFARMFPDRPCKPTYTYSVRLALSSQANEKLVYHDQLADNSSKPYQALALAAHEGINRMVMQSDLRDVFHGVHITGFHPVEMTRNGEPYNGVMNDFYVQLSDNAHESRLKEVIEKYLRNNNYSLGGTDVHASGELMEKLEVNDFDECLSGQFHDCSEHAQCFNLRGTYTCSCVEGFADLSVNTLYPGRICSAEPVGCERCNYHGTCYSRDDRRVLCECFQWYAGSSCHINLKVVLISLVVCGALLTLVLAACAVVACSRRPRPPPRSIVTCIQGMPTLHQGAMPSKQRADRRALISERGESGDASSVQNASLPYMPTKRLSSNSKKCQVICDPPAHEAPPPPPAPAVMIPRARLHPHHTDSRENICRKKSMELSNEDKLISYLESGAAINNDEMRRKHSMESSYSANTNRHNKQGALVSAGFKVSTTVRPDESTMQDDRDDLSSLNKADMEAELARFNTLRKSYSQDELSEWTDAERRIGELTLSEARSVGGTLPASTGRAASSTRLTHQEANTMAERDLGSTFLLPHVHLYKPDLTSDVSEFDSL